MTVEASAHLPCVARSTVLYLEQQSQATFACLTASHQRIEESRMLIRAADAAQVHTHVLGVHYADWRLRLDLAARLREWTGLVSSR